MPREFLKPERKREAKTKAVTRPAMDRMVRAETVTTKRQFRRCIEFDEANWPTPEHRAD